MVYEFTQQNKTDDVSACTAHIVNLFWHACLFEYQVLLAYKTMCSLDKSSRPKHDPDFNAMPRFVQSLDLLQDLELDQLRVK
jgi:hypothetical protein